MKSLFDAKLGRILRLNVSCMLLFLFLSELIFAQAPIGHSGLDSIVRTFVKKKWTVADSLAFRQRREDLDALCKQEDDLSAWFSLYSRSTWLLREKLQSDDLAFKNMQASQGQPFRPPKNNQERKAYSSFLMNYGYVLSSYLGDYLAAKNMYVEAIDLLNELPDSENAVHKSWLYHEVGNVFTRFGDYKRAKIYLDKSVSIKCRSGCSTIDSVGYILDYAITLKSEGKNNEAIGLLQNWLEKDSLDNTDKELLLLQMVENQVASGQLNLAEKNGNDLHQLLDTRDDKNDQVYASSLIALADIKSKKHKMKEAQALGKEAIDHLEKSQKGKNYRNLAKAYLERGNYFYQDGQFQAALNDYHRALAKVIPTLPSEETLAMPKESELYAENTIFQALISKAKAFGRLYQATDSAYYLDNRIACVELAQKTEEKLRHEFAFNQSKLLSLKDSRTWSEMAISSNWDLYKESHNDEYLKKAFSFAERNKSVLLLEGLQQKMFGLTKNVPDSVLMDIRELRGIIQDLRFKSAKLSNEARPNVSLLQQIHLSLSQYQLRLDGLMQRWRIQSPNDLFSYSFDELKQGLPADAAFLEYFYGEEDVYLFVITPRENHYFRLNKEELDRTIKKYHSLTSKKYSDQSTLDTFYQVSRMLDSICLRPYLKEERQLIIVPDGALHKVAFDALIQELDDGEPVYLIQDYSTLYAWSSSLYLYLKDKKPGADTKVLAVLPIEYPLKGEALSPLYYSGDEVEAIGRSYDVIRLSRERATKQHFLDQWSHYNVLHLSLHAKGSAHPWLAFYDEKLYLSELDGLNQPMDMVVFSACESGVGQLDRVEGPISLARGFALTGAASVVQTQWNVNEAASALLFGQFYRNLAEGDRKDEALRKAKLSFLNNCTSNERIPYYWAGIMVFGNETSLVNHTPTWKWAFLGLIIGFLGWLGWSFIYRKK